MSLDLSLEMPSCTSSPNVGSTGIFIRAGGETFEITEAEWQRRNPGAKPARFVVGAVEEGSTMTVWCRNITHNLSTMADQAGLYRVLWRPDETGIETAREAEPHIAMGLARLESDPDHFAQWNPVNGWGSYELLVDFAKSALAACRAFPDAKIRACR